MKSYKYIARDLSGKHKKGLVRAASSTDVLSYLQEQNFTPISVDEITKSTHKKKRAAGRKRVKSGELAALCWQLATMIEGGIPITVALDTIAEDSEKSSLEPILRTVSEKVKKGQSFSDGIAEFPKIFNHLSCALIVAGETSGNLGDALGKLAYYFDSRDKLAKKIKGATAYPIFVLSFIIVIVIFIMAFIVPRFRMIFDQLGGQLPAFTRGFMAFYDILHYNILYIIGFVFVTAVSCILLSKTVKGHYFFSKLILRLPLLGQVFSQAFIATFCKTMSTLLSAGVSVLEVFDVLCGMTNNDIIKSAIVRTRDNIVEGSNISLSMSTTGFFPNMVVKMIQVGEESGSLPRVLEKTSEHYERKVDTTVTTLTSLLEPIMIVSVGAVVSVVVIALYLPVFSMSNITG
ncbi:MAG: type II secretion system F family protein [Sedimentisphaerales bacterium]|nr:type II secretion system F family protein [Sedimentisphaerales bacterium]